MRDRLLVTAAAVVWIGGTLLGSGWFGGGGVQAQGEGLFSDSATLIAPAGPAFSIWGVIYLGLLGYVVWQWLPPAARSEWTRVTRVPAAAAIGLNGIWLLVVFAGWVFISVLVMIGIVVALGLILARTAELPAEGWPTLVFVAATFGLYLGWICVATCANIASWLVGLGAPVESQGAAWTTVFLLFVVIGLAAYLIGRTSQVALQTAFAAAVTWGTAWVSAGRLTGDLINRPVGFVAAFTALCVVGLWVVTVLRADDRGRGLRTG